MAVAWRSPAPVTPLADAASSDPPAAAQVGSDARASGVCDPNKSEETPGTDAMPAQGPSLIAVCLWNAACEACKKLGDKYARVKADLEGNGDTLFVRFDTTTPESQKQSRMLAAALGLESIYDTYEGESGKVLLIDPRTREIVDTLSASQPEAALRSNLIAAIQR